MAKVVKRAFYYKNLTLLKSFIDSFDSPLVTTSLVPTTHYTGEDLILNFEDKCTVTYYINGEWLDVDYDYGQGVDTYHIYKVDSSLPCTICSSDNMFHLQLFYDNSIYVMIYSKVSAATTIFGSSGHYAYWGAYYMDTPITVYEVETGIPFNYGKPLNYSTSVSSIQYLNHTTLLNGGVKVLSDNNFIACTNVTPSRVITINGQNYYSVGTNTLIPMDPS